MNAQRLKLLAVIFMTADHLGKILNSLYRYMEYGAEFDHYMNDNFWQMTVIGRLAFPIFCFLIAEGCAHTKNIKRYIGRLTVFAVISQIPYQMFHSAQIGFRNGRDFFFHFTSGNVLVTLALGAAAVFFYQKLFENGKLRLLNIFGIIAATLALGFFRGEYGLYGFLIILPVYVFRKKEDVSPDFKVFGNKYIQVLCCTLATLWYYMFTQHESVYMVIGAVLSALPLLLYNKKPGSRKWKWAFYIYYPAHMLVLSAVMYVVML